MVGTSLLLSVATAVLSTGCAVVLHPSTIRQRGLQESSMASSGFDDVGGLTVLSHFEETTSGLEAECAGPPIYAIIWQEGFCSPAECDFFTHDDSGLPFSNVSTTTECSTDLNATIEQLYEGATYVWLDFFDDDDCATWRSSTVMVVDNKCHTQQFENAQTMSYLTTLSTIGSITDTTFIGGGCSGEISEYRTFDQQQLSSSSCTNKIRVSTNAEAITRPEGSGSGGVHSVGGAASQLAVGSVAILTAVLLFT